MNTLFSGITIKNKQIKNRIVLPPTVFFGWTDDSGIVSEDHIRHYEALAASGIGIIILGAHAVTKDGRLANTQMGLWSDDHIEGVSRLIEACHKHGAVVLVQIHHAGYRTPKNVADPCAAPSDYVTEKINARALSLAEIKAIQSDFINAAVRAEKAGADGIELHGAHGYLISQFFSPIVNQRQDQYGGSFENRTRFAVEILTGIKEKVSPDFIIGFRLGANEPALEDGIRIAQLLEETGVDLLHVSAGVGSDQLPKAPEGFPYNWIVYMGTEVRKHVKVPVIVVNEIQTPERAAYLIENDLADLAAIGRGLLADHNWARHAYENQPIISCLKCPKCAWFVNGKNCPRYPLQNV